MKKTTILIISILVIFITSMSFLLVACGRNNTPTVVVSNNTPTNPLIGSWEHSDAQHGRNYKLTLEKQNDNIIVTQFDSHAVEDLAPVNYNEETQEYEVKHTLGTKFLGIKVINNNNLEVKRYSTSGFPTYIYARIS